MGAESKLGLGIDIGTTFTAAAIALPDDRVEALPLGETGPSVPTALFVQPSGLLVGEPAIRRGQSEPEALTREFKRRFGDTTPVEVSGASYWVEYLYGILLEWVVNRATEHLGARPQSVVVSHPAAWGQYKLELLVEATQRAGIPDAMLFSEPSCVAFQYAVHASLPEGAYIGVYDFGGGTFDAAIVGRTQAGFEIAGRPAGLERAGGIDVDRAIFDMVLDRTPELAEAVEAGGDDANLAAVLNHVRTSCVDAKHGLSSDTVATIPVLLPSGLHPVHINRAELEAAIRPLVEDTLDTFDQALSSASMPADQLQAIVLAGGSARIPLVAQLLQARYRRPLALDLHPKLTVSYGAASKAVHERPMALSRTAYPPVVPMPPPPAPNSDGSPVYATPAATTVPTTAPITGAVAAPASVGLGGGMGAMGGGSGGMGPIAGPGIAEPEDAELDSFSAFGEAPADFNGHHYVEDRKPSRGADIPVAIAALALLIAAVAGGFYLTGRSDDSSDAAETADQPVAPPPSPVVTEPPVVTVPPVALVFPPKPLLTQDGLSVLDAGFTAYQDGGGARKVTWAAVVKNTLTDKTIQGAQLDLRILDSAGAEVGKVTVPIATLAPGATGAVAAEDTAVTKKPAKLKVQAVKGVVAVSAPVEPGMAEPSGITLAAGATPGSLTASGHVRNTYEVDLASPKATLVVTSLGKIVCGGHAEVGPVPAGKTVKFDASVACPSAPDTSVAAAFVDLPAEVVGAAPGSDAPSS